jgi:DNA polymerase bacteriophage-type
VTPALHIDFETRSAVDLKTAGVHRYAEHHSTGIWCMAWALGDKRGIWKEGEYFPKEVLDHVTMGGRVIAHNAAFERAIWNKVLSRQIGHRVFVPPLHIAQMDCTVARCAVLGIPSGLDHAGKVLGLEVQKDKAGHANMMILARPKTIGENGACTWNDTPERLALQYSYCQQDVAVESEIDARVPALTAAERAVWELDQKINDRGVMLDIPTIQAAQAVVAAEKDRLNDEMAEATGGAVTAVSQVKRLTDWIKARGVACEGLGKDNIRAVRKAAENDAAVLKALGIRAEGGKASTAKLTAMLNCVCKDDRARGLLAYHGAATGRWAGRLIQPQNLYRNDPDEDGDDIKHAIAVLQGVRDPARAAVSIKMLSGQPAITMVAKSLRAMFIAHEGARFVGGDLSNIEGRIAAWITDERWKVEAFRAYDEKRGPDLYRVAYARSFGVADPATVTGARRQVGKVTELSLQYQGSVGAWIKMAANYGVQPSDVVGVVHEAVGPDIWAAQWKRYPSATDKHGLFPDEWSAIKLIVGGWRDAHPLLVQSWWDLQDAAIEAVANPGVVVPVLQGRVRYLFARGFLWCSLPSGRTISYCNPRVVTADASYLQMPDASRVKLEALSADEIADMQDQGGEIVKVSRRRVDYDGFEGEKKRWATMNLYGGMQFAHVVSGTARDIMVWDMLEADRLGYPLVLTVHDELLAECPNGIGSAAELERIMSTPPPWVEGDLPLAAKAWEDVRYAK